jgi:mitochondrial fission protein ELM1
MAQRPVRALLFSDGKPGHYHQAEGVLAAIARLRPVETVRLEVRRRLLIPNRTLLRLINGGVSPTLVLWLGYGLRAGRLPGADLVVSAGGQTLAANAATAKLLNAPNVFCGRLRQLAPEHVHAALVPHERLARLPNQIVCLPPSPLDPDSLGRTGPAQRFGPANPPRLAGVLIGGNAGAVRYKAKDWERLVAFLAEAHQKYGIRWIAVTSRRSGRFIADRLAQMVRAPHSAIERFIDYRTAGAGGLASVLPIVQAILCTDDSTTMICEVVGARVPVVGVGPERALRLAYQERELRDHLERKGCYRFIPIHRLTPESFLAALFEIEPIAGNPLDDLAHALRRHIPELFAA